MGYKGQVLDEGMEQLEYVATAADTGGAMVSIRVTSKPGRPAPPLHVHPAQEERFRVERGSMGVQVGSRSLVAGPGEELVVPPATVHTFWNAGSEPLVVVGEIRPALDFEGFTETIHGLIRDGRLEAGKAPRNPLRIATVAWEFRREWRLAAMPAPVRLLLPVLAWLGRRLGYPARLNAGEVAAAV